MHHSYLVFSWQKRGGGGGGGVGGGGLDIRQVVIMLYTVSSRKTRGVSEMNKDR